MDFADSTVGRLWEAFGAFRHSARLTGSAIERSRDDSIQFPESARAPAWWLHQRRQLNLDTALAASLEPHTVVVVVDGLMVATAQGGQRPSEAPPAQPLRDYVGAGQGPRADSLGGQVQGNCEASGLGATIRAPVPPIWSRGRASERMAQLDGANRRSRSSSTCRWSRYGGMGRVRQSPPHDALKCRAQVWTFEGS